MTEGSLAPMIGARRDDFLPVAHMLPRANVIHRCRDHICDHQPGWPDRDCNATGRSSLVIVFAGAMSRLPAMSAAEYQPRAMSPYKYCRFTTSPPIYSTRN
jgi:hypothetical protein